MNVKKRSLIVLLLGLVITALGAVIPCVVMKNYESIYGSVGIIGGAGMPTYQFLLFRTFEGLPFCLMLWGVSLTLAAAVCLFFSKTVQTHCHRKTTILALGMSSVAALGLLCGFMLYTFSCFGERYKHPIEYPASILLGVICLATLVILAWLYYKNRSSVRGMIPDLATTVWFFPSFFYFWSFVYTLLEG